MELCSLWDDLAQAGAGPATRLLRYEVTAASNDAAAALGLPPGAEIVRLERLRLGKRSGIPLPAMQRTTYSDSGRAVEFGTHVYRAETYSFQITLVGR
jgi:DNA-binding GntR family transcriptional regulator